jgi:hypothetical protein
MATVPASLLGRRSGPPAPPPQEGASVAALPAPDPVVVPQVTPVVSVTASTPGVVAEQQEVAQILQGYVAALPAGEAITAMAQTLADVVPTLSARALSVMSPVIIDFTTQAADALVSGDPTVPTPITLPTSYVNQYKSFLETQALTELQHLVTGLQTSLQRQTLSRDSQRAASDRTERDLSLGYPYLISQLASVSERIATLGPVNWGLVAESAGSSGMADVQDMLNHAASQTYQQQQDLEVQAKSSHIVARHALDVQKRHAQQVQLAAALLAGAQAAVSHNTGSTTPSVDTLIRAMRQGALTALKNEVLSLAKRKSSRTATPAAPVLMSGSNLPGDSALA